jgi:hypothetical protein
VILRAHVPNTSILALPVHGKNEQGEHEIVVLGTKDRWSWDAYRRSAPTLEQNPIVESAAEAIRAAAKALVIDLYEIDHDQPHWLKGVLPPEVRRWRERGGKLPQKRSLAGRETKVHRAADAHYSKFHKVVKAAISAAHDAVNRPRIRLAKTPEAAISAALPAAGVLETKLGKAIQPLLLEAMAAGGEAGASMLFRTAKARPLGVDFSFTSSDEASQSWAKKYAAKLVKDIGRSTRQAIRDAVAAVFEDNDIDALEEKIFDAIGNEDRATTIARQESMSAANEGQRMMWKQAQDEGYLEAGTKREWLATEGYACPECEAMNGKTARVNGTYAGGIAGPPLHVNSRCTEGIVG